jgi:glutathione S-transferase
VRLYHIPFSHNCIKVRRALELKGIVPELVAIDPLDRREVTAISGQSMVPLLVDGDHIIHDSTAILLYLERTQPEPVLLPHQPAARAVCLVFEDWADSAWMELSRRLVFWHVVSTPNAVNELLFQGARGWMTNLKATMARRYLRRRFNLSRERHAADVLEATRLARIAIDVLGDHAAAQRGAPLIGDRLTIADIALAAMIAPLRRAGAAITAVQDLAALLDWSTVVLGDSLSATYATPDPS